MNLLSLILPIFLKQANFSLVTAGYRKLNLWILLDRAFYRLDASPVTQPTVSKHLRCIHLQ